MQGFKFEYRVTCPDGRPDEPTFNERRNADERAAVLDHIHDTGTCLSPHQVEARLVSGWTQSMLDFAPVIDALEAAQV